ncbi:MAG: RNB domain-containing ribonuclease [bacterium]|nr:RNB domain-containing ribonuclease [bacterium]
MPTRSFKGAAPQELYPLLDSLRDELEISPEFSPEAEEQAATAATRTFDAPDMTEIPFVTIDPPGARDLDQAVHIERHGDGFRVRYAIAAIGWFVPTGSTLDAEVRERAVTVYGPSGSYPLHPLSLSGGAASLLAGEVRPAYVWTFELDPEGEPTATTVEFAMVRSRAQLTYEQVQSALDGGQGLPADTPSDLPHLLAEVGRLRIAIEASRGGVSLNIPDQDVVRTEEDYELAFRATLPVESYNAQISLLTGIEAARLMREAGVGIFRTLPRATKRDIRRMRLTAKALGIEWPGHFGYPEFVRSLDSSIPAHAAFMVQATTLFRGAGYLAFTDGAPHDRMAHGAIASEYAHVTAPLRRLVDRYGLEVCLAHCEGRDVPEQILVELPEIPEIMGRGISRANRYERGAVDLIEALILEPHVGEDFAGVVVDADDNGERGTIMVANPAAQARLTGDELPLGEAVEARLAEADPETRRVTFVLEH